MAQPNILRYGIIGAILHEYCVCRANNGEYLVPYRALIRQLNRVSFDIFRAKLFDANRDKMLRNLRIGDADSILDATSYIERIIMDWWSKTMESEWIAIRETQIMGEFSRHTCEIFDEYIRARKNNTSLVNVPFIRHNELSQIAPREIHRVSFGALNHM